MRTVLANATVIDCVNPRPVAGASVTIDRGRIVEVLGSGRSPDTRDAHVIDLGGAYLLPGLWDVHIHPDYLAATGASVAEQTAIFGHRLMQALTESGVVGVRCAGAAHFMDVAWKRAFDAGQYVGPRVFAAGYFLTTTGGHFLTSGHARECDGPYGFVRAIREQIAARGDRLRRRIGAGLNCRFGFGSETLLKFGFRPRRPPVRKAGRETSFAFGSINAGKLSLTLDPNVAEARDVIRDLNPVLRGWGNYFGTGNASRKFNHLDTFVWDRLTKLLRQRGGQRRRPFRLGDWPRERFVKDHGLHRLLGTIRYPGNARPA